MRATTLRSATVLALCVGYAVATLTVAIDGRDNPDPGNEYGQISIKNNCGYELNYQSTGAHFPGQHDLTGTIAAASTYTEKYRKSCSRPGDFVDAPVPWGPCEMIGKPEGQGVSFKIFRDDPNIVTQLE